MTRASRDPRGLTLVELLVVLAIVAFLAVAAGPAMGALTGANARKAAGELAGAMRWLFDTAALRHATCRLALDLDKGAFWAECAQPGPVRGAPARAEEEEALAERFPDERSAEMRRLLARSRFGEFSDRTVKRRDLPGGAAIAAVWTPDRRDPVEKGLAHVYFHAQGEAQPAQVTVADGSHVYTVVLEPLTGRARIVSGRPQVPR